MIEVAAAVLVRPDGHFLLTSRPAGKLYSGYWEFPGGKIEKDESVLQALARELYEELGIQIEQASPWITRIYAYQHATVRLHFYRVFNWHGELIGRENQQLSWQTPDKVVVAPLLPANQPIIRSLSLPSVYGITQAAELGESTMLQKIELAAQQGLGLLQVREKSMSKAQLKQFIDEIINRTKSYPMKIFVNEDIALANEVGVNSVHLTSSQLMDISVRPDVAWCAASCHNVEELYHAEQLGLDFVVLGPVLPTKSHPGAIALGWRKFSSMIRDYPLPVYALGGMTRADLPFAIELGAHGIAMLRDIWKIEAVLK
ncbi:MAG: Nudix family hydrolase [Nitrosomonas sp.]|nr:Nudix family hydrolase [Nitrosomonas sp.]MBK7363961.1 Nudix family hydrolase [Nitrosomonas sp.]